MAVMSLLHDTPTEEGPVASTRTLAVAVSAAVAAALRVVARSWRGVRSKRVVEAAVPFGEVDPFMERPGACPPQRLM